MASRCGMNSTHQRDSARLSSSLPQSLTSRENLESFITSNAALSRSRQDPLSPEDTTSERRPTAHRQLFGRSKTLLRRQKENQVTRNTSGSPTAGTQPVLVKAYNPSNDNARSSATMSSSATNPSIDMPSVAEFGIEAILRAIEPEIRSTLDSIAEICGRSKLSLANEYGSHIAPFGEVNAPPGSLLAIQETATNGAELLTDTEGHITIVDHDNDLYGSDFGLLDNLRQTALATGYQSSSRTQRNDESGMNQRGNNTRPANDGQDRTPPCPTAAKHYHLMGSKADSLALLGSPVSKSHKTNITSSVVPFETRLEAQATRSSWPSVPPDTPKASPFLQASSFASISRRSQASTAETISFANEVHAWLDWLKSVVQRKTAGQPLDHVRMDSAENSLRALLFNHQEQAAPVSTV